MAEACIHEWRCPNTINVPASDGLTIVLPLYCTKCATTRTTIAPPPDHSRVAQARLVPHPLRA